MSIINNTPRFSNFLLKAVRGTLEHRASWFYLLLNEVEKKGIAWEDVGYPAIHACGSMHGRDLVRAGGTNSLTGLKKTLFTLPARLVFDMKTLKAVHNDLSIEFRYCPLVAAWQKLGCTDDQIARLCDMAMEGDRGIAKAYGGRMLLGETIAKGHGRCQIRFVKD